MTHRSAFSLRRRGQALIETAFVIVILVFFTLAIVEFGRAFMIANMVTHTARNAARFAATLTGDTYRDSVTGCFTPAAQTRVQAHVDALIGTVMGNNGQLDPVVVAQELDVSGSPLVRVSITGSIDPATGLIPGLQLPVDRSATFRDEDRKLDQACS